MANGENKKVEKIVEAVDKSKAIKTETREVTMFAYNPEDIQQVANFLNTLEIKAGIDNAKKLVGVMNILERGQQINMKKQEE